MARERETQNPQEKQQEAPKGEQKEQRTSGSREIERSRGGGQEVMRRGEPLMGRLTPFAASPFTMVRRMMEDFERMIGEPFSGAGMMREPLGREMQAWMPEIDVFERGDQLVVRADLPGIQKDQVSLQITGDGLVIEGQRRDEREERERGFYRRERTYGSFSRMVPLPDDVDPETATAEMNNGVLEVCFKMSEQRGRGKRIEISEGKGSTGAPPSVH